MTMSPPGDKGQRYEISAFGYPFEQQWCIIGWVETMDGVERMMHSLTLAPGATSVKVRDRWKATPAWPDDTFTRYCGVLR
jgi:hypothetical protein